MEFTIKTKKETQTVDAFNYRDAVRRVAGPTKDMREVDFSNKDLSYLTFSLNDFRDADFRGAVLNGTTFFRCDLTGAKFHGAIYDDNLLVAEGIPMVQFRNYSTNSATLHAFFFATGYDPAIQFVDPIGGEVFCTLTEFEMNLPKTPKGYTIDFYVEYPAMIEYIRSIDRTNKSIKKKE